MIQLNIKKSNLERLRAIALNVGCKFDKNYNIIHSKREEIPFNEFMRTFHTKFNLSLTTKEQPNSFKKKLWEIINHIPIIYGKGSKARNRICTTKKQR